MSPLAERGVPRREHAPLNRQAEALDWELFRVFLEVHRAGSFRSASDVLGMSINSLRRRLAELEAVFGVPLFTRHHDGLRPTSEADRIVGGARAMEEAAFRLLRTRHALASEIEGEVKVAVTEGLGAIWLTPRLVEFLEHHPGLRINLNCGTTSADVLRMEADVAIQLTRPTALDLKCVRLGYLHSMPFASSGYAATHGLPATVEDLADHRIILQVTEQASHVSLFQKVAPTLPRTPVVCFMTNTSSTHALAIANGAGIGWLPTYVSSLHSGLVPIDCGPVFDFDIWLTYHPDIEAIPRVRRTIDWLKTCFSPKVFPFFSEDCIHPRDLPIMEHLIPLKEWYRGFVP